MSRTTLLGLLTLLLVLVQTSCSSSSPSTSTQPLITDTLGKTFSVDCTSSLCALTAQDSYLTPNSCEDGLGTDTFVLVFRHILTITALQISPSGDIQLNEANPARPVVCSADADCLSPGLSVSVNNTPVSYSCLGGLCQLPGLPLATDDVIALCQADLPWPAASACPYVSNPQFAERMVEVAAICGSQPECSTVPADCRQPNAALDAGTLDAGTGPLDAGASTPDVAVGPLDAGASAPDAM